MPELDHIDGKILQELQKDGRASNADIGKAVGLDASSVSRRIKTLQDRGVIAGFRVVLNPEKVGLPVIVYALLKLHHNGGVDVTAFGNELNALPHLVEWSRILGRWDYMMKFTVRDMNHYDLVLRRLDRTHVDEIESFPALGHVCNKALLLM